MKHRSVGRVATILLTVAGMTAGIAPSAAAAAPYEFAGPVFGLAAGPGDVLFAADAGAGVVRLQGDAEELVVDLPGVTDIAPVRPGRMWAIAGRKLFTVNHGKPHFLAGLGKFERLVNPDEGEVDSNPFDVTALGTKRALIADAGANAVLIANRRGGVDWIATLPDELVSTDNAKTLAGCPDATPENAEICDLPDEIPGQAVATSVAIGPDGAYYVSELKGFPAPLGQSRIWRIEPDARHVHCDADAVDSPCTVVADGFTSIVDLTFGSDGTAYVVELDEASWFAVEVVTDAMVGGTVNTCDSTTWTCTEAATDLTQPMAIAINESGPFVVVSALIPGETAVVPLP
ncbi:MAG: ScyD/ScyE family protein [Actinomycetota bacterium]